MPGLTCTVLMPLGDGNYSVYVQCTYSTGAIVTVCRSSSSVKVSILQ